MRSKHRGNTKNAETGQLRIIGGQWRGRKLPFPALEGLRPTSDRTRETLFNWLTPRVQGATCLDMFAGSGALGLEALSRGAAYCDFIERQEQAARAITSHLNTLNASDQGRIITGDALALGGADIGPYDLIFIDPPFAENLAQAALELVLSGKLLSIDARVYLELPRTQKLPPALQEFEILRDKNAGDVRYLLLTTTANP